MQGVAHLSFLTELQLSYLRYEMPHDAKVWASSSSCP